MPEIAYVNGVFGPIAEAQVSIEDRGFQFGDGIYEVLFRYDGHLFMPDEHMARLRTSAAEIDLPYDFDANPLLSIITEGLSRSGFADAIVYIQITRGVAPRSHCYQPGMTPTVVMTFKQRPTLSPELVRRGASVMTTIDERWSRCFVKAITLLPNVLAKTGAVRRGFDDAIFVTESGEARECTSANLYIVHDGAIQFPPRNHSVLHGITQLVVLDCAKRIGAPTIEGVIGTDDLRRADEVFMSSTAVEVLGITSIDGTAVTDGNVGPITRELHEAFLNSVKTGRLSESA